MMASKTFSGQLDQAMDELAAEGNKILFIPQQNVGEVLEGAASEMTVESDGTYSIKLAYNTYSIYHYSDVTKRKRLLADGIVVSSETSVTTIPGLIGSTVPVTEDSVLTIQGYLDEANESATAAAASEAAVTSRVSAYEVESTEYLINSFDGSALSTGDIVRTLGYYGSGGTGAGLWTKTGNTGDASQSPSDTGLGVLYDSQGYEYSIYGNSDTIEVESLGSVDATTIKIAVTHASSNSISNVIASTSFNTDETVEIVGDNVNVTLNCSIVGSESLTESVVTIHSSSYLNFHCDNIYSNRATAGDSIAGYNGVTVTNSTRVTVVGTRVSSTSNHAIIFTQNSEGGAAGVALTNLGDVSYCKAIDCTTTDTGNGAIIFQSGSNGWAERNVCKDFGNEGIQFIDGWSIGFCHNNEIVADESAAIALEQHTGRGVTTTVSDIIISNNKIETSWHGLVLEHNAAGFANISITDNVFKMNSESGLSLAAITASNAGVMIDRIVIANNIIKGVTGQKLNDGVRFYNPEDSSGYVSGCIITGNIIEDTRYSIIIAGGVSTDGKTITSNRIKNASIGISAEDGSGSIISNNAIEQCNEHFVKVGATVGDLRGVIINSNTMRFANSALTSGVLIEAGDYTIEQYMITNNFIDTSTNSATQIDDEVAASNAVIDNNVTR